MCPASIIAIDGPAGSGKSTLGSRVALELGYLLFDTGVLYRAVTWLALEKGIDPRAEADLAKLVGQTTIDVRKPEVRDGRFSTVIVDGMDVSWAIREPRVDANVSAVSAHPKVREALLPVQREIAARGSVVMVGRDIGTVVAPDADLKIYLDASLAVRAERRLKDLVTQGHAPDPARVQNEIRQRDQIDSRRSTAPLVAAADAILVNSDDLTIEEEVTLVTRLALEHDRVSSVES
jgi:CMP/dCMP kinase